MSALLDVNFLLALVQPDHVHFEAAHAWWDKNSNDGWASCPLTQNGFIRIISQPTYSRPMPVRRAIDELAEYAAQTNHTFWPDDISLLDPKIIDRSHILGPKQLTDVYLLALAVKNGGRLATFDRAIPIRAVRGAESRHVAVI